MKQLYMLTIAMVLLSAVVQAGVCSLGVSEKPSFELGDQTTVTFINLYTPATTGNVTLDLSGAPGLTLVSGSNPADGVLFAGTATWVVDFTALGQQDLVATMVNENGGVLLCTANKTVNVTAEPNVTATLSTLTQIDVAAPKNFITVLNNIADGTATDVRMTLSNAAGGPITNYSYNFSSLAAHTSTPVQHTFTPQTCGISDSITVNVQYRDMQGNLMPLATDTQVFNVTGSDIDVTATATPAAVLPSGLVEFNATITNPGTQTAQNVVVDYLVNGTSVHTAALGDVVSGGSIVDSYSWSTATENAYELMINVTADHDCVLSDNTATALFTVTSTLPPVCGNGVCEAGESSSTCSADCGLPPSSGGGGGGGGSGGGGSRIFYLVLTEEKPEATLPLRVGDTVKYDWNKNSYSFIVRKVYSDIFRMGVSESASYVSYDLVNMKDHELNLDTEKGGDLGVRPANKGQGMSDVTFYLLGLGNKRVIDILPPGSMDRRVVEVSDEVESAGVINYEPEPEYAEGKLEFDEELDSKSAAPLWGGLLLALLIALAGTGLYMGITKK